MNLTKASLVAVCLAGPVLASLTSCSGVTTAKGVVTAGSLLQPIGQRELEAVKASFVVRVSDAFVVAQRSSGASKLTADAIASIEPPLRQILTRLDSNARDIVVRDFSKETGGQVSPAFKAPRLRLEPNESGVSFDPDDFEIVFGADVLEANLIASVEGILGDQEFRREFREALTRTSPEPMEEFRELVEFLRSVAGMPSFIAAVRASPETADAHRRIYASLALSEAIADKYYGSLAFVLAHEVGHAALQHQFTVDCSTRAADELSADQFAAFVLADAFMIRSVRHFDGVANSIIDEIAARMDGPYLLVDTGSSDMTMMVYLVDELLEHHTGFATFLGKAYTLGPFSRDLSCYPTADQRLQKVRAAQRLAVTRRGKLVLRKWVDDRNRGAVLSGLLGALIGG